MPKNVDGKSFCEYCGSGFVWVKDGQPWVDSDGYFFDGETGKAMVRERLVCEKLAAKAEGGFLVQWLSFFTHEDIKHTPGGIKRSRFRS